MMTTIYTGLVSCVFVLLYLDLQFLDLDCELVRLIRSSVVLVGTREGKMCTFPCT